MANSIIHEVPHDGTTLFLREASEQELLQCWHRNSKEWRGKLPLDDYIARDQYLRMLPLTRNGGIRHWILSTTPNPSSGSDTAPFYGACETIEKKAVVKENGTVRDVKSWGICSVFVAEEYRGKGYAGAMMKALGEVIDKMGVDEDGFSVLYSDIGKTFYERNGGWKATSTEEIQLPVLQVEGEVDGVKWLGKEDFGWMGEQAVVDVRKAVDETEGERVMAVLPTGEVFEWAVAHGGFVAEKLFQREVSVVGAECEGSWVLWKVDVNAGGLAVLFVHGEGEGLRKCFMAACVEAGKWGLGKVVVWRPSKGVLEVVRGVKEWEGVSVGEREGSIPALRWKNAEDVEVEWVANEKYAWC
ncbi:hypothetical protein BJ508DRAFT_39504 [Ascobolus immersus RN42]|uniref:Uncharacterized protein n=1 Tax=Ascobolus immersus RN42 TaxID=1160509 RepID=A0A3N4HK20_ASCIM|nr:hypothetical protein BJ508DRAFT_39504 [Ascobolus immersus RN42]